MGLNDKRKHRLYRKHSQWLVTLRGIEGLTWRSPDSHQDGHRAVKR
jgi:hypothetical protein